jgi:hypothetical protein
VLLLWLGLFCIQGKELPVVKEFQNPVDVSEEYLSDPYSMIFNAKGDLFIIDRIPAKIHAWKSDGTYARTFGRRGEGPGELLFPFRIISTEEGVYVWDLRQRVSLFKEDGEFVRSLSVAGVLPRTFSKIGDNLFLLAYQRFNSPTDMRQVFQLMDEKGERIDPVVKDLKNSFTLRPIEGNNDTTIKAFGPEADIQHDGKGNTYFGFSESTTLYRIDSEGKIQSQHQFELPNPKPTDEEKDLVLNLSFPNPSQGGRLSLKDLPNLDVDFSHPKAYYTHFLIKGDKVVFAVTPLGSTNGIGNGFRQATYSICDFATGKRVKSGRYAYREDSIVLYRDGHILAVALNEDDEFTIREVTIEGL